MLMARDTAIEWNNKEAVQDVIRALAFGSHRTRLEALRTCESFDVAAFEAVADETGIQLLVGGVEYRTLDAFLATALVCAVRDFAPNQESVDVSAMARDVAIHIAEASTALRVAMRRQIRRTLNSPQWQVHARDDHRWNCPWCAARIKEDGTGEFRRNHIQEHHPDAMPCRTDHGMPMQWNREMARNNLLVVLAGVMTAEFYREDKQYFRGTKLEESLQRNFAGNRSFTGLITPARPTSLAVGF